MNHRCRVLRARARVRQVGPAGAITGGGSFPSQLPTSTSEYNYYGDVAEVEETANSKTRTTTTTYDGAGRVSQVAVSSNLAGTAVPTTTTTYVAATGRVATVSSAGGGTPTITKAYDQLGRLVSYTDAGSGVTTTQYDAQDRPTLVTRADSTTTTHVYDTGVDPRGVLTKITDSVLGDITGVYDADGGLVTQNLPGGYSVTTTEDPAGEVTSRVWTKTGLSDPFSAEQVEVNAHGQWSLHTGKFATQGYLYDKAGRLTQVNDSFGAVCTIRVYGFDKNSNRTHKAQAAGSDPTCPSVPVKITVGG